VAKSDKYAPAAQQPPDAARHRGAAGRTSVGAAKFMSAFSCAPGDIKSCVTQRNEMQQLFKEESRLGIPVSFINEGLHGGAPGGTIFPEPIGQGMSWNVSLVGKIAAAIAAEASAIGVDAVRRQS
jgi:beta-glucosidase-like glycosyl hydrolase